MENMYEGAKNAYSKFGIDTEAIMAKLSKKSISIHC